MPKSSGRPRASLRRAPAPLTTAQVKRLFGPSAFDRILAAGKVTRTRILNLYVYAEDDDDLKTKKTRLEEVVEDCVDRDPVIEEFHLVRRTQKRYREEFQWNDLPSALVQSQVRELVALDKIREVRKFPMTNPPGSYFCHKSRWTDFQILVSSACQLLAENDRASPDELLTLAEHQFGTQSKLREALQAVREVLLYQGLADPTGSILTLAGGHH